METVDLAFPLQGGSYLVTGRGSTTSLNGHMMTLNPTTPRMVAFRGQSYAVDLVKLGPLGLRSGGVRPRDPSNYQIFGEPVFAPCTGKVIQTPTDYPTLLYRKRIGRVWRVTMC